MAKNDFDFEFDFEKDFSADSGAVYGSDYNDADLDFSDFDMEDYDMETEKSDYSEEDYGDFDLNELSLDELMGEDASGDSDYSEEDFDGDYGEEADSAENAAEYASEDDYYGEASYGEEPYEDSYDEESRQEDDFGMGFDDDGYTEEQQDDELMDFSRRASFFGAPEGSQGYYDPPQYHPSAYQQEEAQEIQEEPQEQAQDVPFEQNTPVEEETVSGEEQDVKSDSRLSKLARMTRREKKERAEKPPVKLTVPPVFQKLWNLYFPPREVWDPKPDPNNPRRRRKKTKAQIFKEAYLPAILACLTLVLILSFVVGAIGNGIKQKKANDEAAKESSISAANQAELIKSESEMLLERAALQAEGYDFEGAINTLNSFSGNINEFETMVTKLSEYVNARDSLVEFNSPSTIPNLSFHVLIADPARAYADKDYGGLYNRNFVTTDEFQRILEQLYKNNYILVDFDSFVSGNVDLEGNVSFFSVPIKLPEGKKPVMITETMVNYYQYMVDGNKDGVADAGGDGFASKLVVDAAGDVKAEYIDINGQTHVGNYDLVPILEDFIKQHPDFSYRGARATLAVTGDEGVFGWRCNTTYIATVGQAFYDEQVLGAKEVVEALRSKGYRIASYSYKNEDYGQLNANQIQADLTSWNDQITPILGQVDTIVFAKNSDIRDYTGPKFNVLYTSGFRYLITNAEQPYAEVNNTYVRQSRLMVTGNSMAWKSAQFTNLSLFDPNIVLDMVSRKQVPN